MQDFTSAQEPGEDLDLSSSATPTCQSEDDKYSDMDFCPAEMDADAIEYSLLNAGTNLSTQSPHPRVEAEEITDQAPSSLWSIPSEQLVLSGAQGSKEDDGCRMGEQILEDGNASSVVAFYPPQYMIGCTCLESTNLRIALHHLQGATRATAALLAQTHSDDAIHQHCTLLQEIVQFDSILS